MPVMSAVLGMAAEIGFHSRSPDTLHPVIDPTFWNGRNVLVTGHTGFKGAWMALWLQALGARVSGFSLGAPTAPSLYELARVSDSMVAEVAADVRDYSA